MAAVTASAAALALTTTTGWEEPAGKCRASVSCAVTDSTSVRNCSVCDSPIFVVSSPAARLRLMIPPVTSIHPGSSVAARESPSVGRASGSLAADGDAAVVVAVDGAPSDGVGVASEDP